MERYLLKLENGDSSLKQEGKWKVGLGIFWVFQIRTKIWWVFLTLKKKGERGHSTVVCVFSCLSTVWVCQCVGKSEKKRAKKGYFVSAAGKYILYCGKRIKDKWQFLLFLFLFYFQRYKYWCNVYKDISALDFNWILRKWSNIEFFLGHICICTKIKQVL